MAADAPGPLRDADDRHRAATEFGTNFVVRAGAGTGKTSLLVERALNAIGSDVATMDSIAAITFTEKAAGEMRERLAVGLDRLRTLARDGGKVDLAGEADRAYRYLVETAGVARDEVARRCLAAMERLDEGTVVTIHGFCAELLRAHPVEAGVDPGFAVDSGERAESLGHDVWEAFVRRELGPEANRAELWERLLSSFSLSGVGETARLLARFAVPAGLLEANGGGSALEPLRTEARVLVDGLDSWLAREGDLTKLGSKCFRGLRKALDALATADVAAFRKVLQAEGDLADRVEGTGGLGGARKGAGEAAVDAAKRLGDEARALCRGLLQVDDAAFGLLVRAVKPFVREYRERYLRRGLVGFDGLLVLARDLLRDHPDVRRRLKQRFRLLLVDEFQDTDPLQYEIVLFLAEEPDGEAREPFRARLDRGRLFVVGDPKQSIYRFRGADYAAFSRVVKHILDEAEGEELSLVGNFRSVPGVVDSVNELFAHPRGCWSPAEDYQAPYDPIDAVRPAAGREPAVDVWTVELADDVRAADRRAAEGRVIAEAIEQWAGPGKGLGYEKITLLFRACTNLSYYLRALRERNIPFVVDGGRDFLRRPEVAQLMATLRAVSRPNDQPSLLAYLRSPAGAVSDVELACYAREDGAWDWSTEPHSDRFPNLANAFRTLRDLETETRDLPADRLVRRLLDRTAMLPLGALAFEGAQRVANLQKLAAAVGDLARDGTLSLEEVIDALEEGRLEEIESDRPLADDAAEAVRITNIHRMKGLENDVIIVPDLARRDWSGRDTSDPVCVPVTQEGTRLLAVRCGDLTNSARAWHEIENRRHEDYEETRVLYVALTRARERLVLIAARPSGNSTWLRALEPWGYDAAHPPADGELLAGGRVRHRLCEPPSRPTPKETKAPEAETRAVSAYEEAVAKLRDEARPPLSAPSALEDADSVEREPPTSKTLGRETGEVLHRLLERWDGKERDRMREDLEAQCGDTARERGVVAADLQREAAEILDAFLASDLAHRFGRVERIGAEVPVLVRDEKTGRTYRGSIDLLYRDAGGEIVVADYKTDRETDVDRLGSRYGQRLGVYADAVRRALDLAAPPRAELWMLRTGKVVPISTAGAGPTPPGGRG
jgi:ATP-dependent helicase/nuclease subunit A